LLANRNTPAHPLRHELRRPHRRLSQPVIGHHVVTRKHSLFAVCVPRLPVFDQGFRSRNQADTQHQQQGKTKHSCHCSSGKLRVARKLSGLYRRLGTTSSWSGIRTQRKERTRRESQHSLGADSTHKCNSPSGEERQAALASEPCGLSARSARGRRESDRAQRVWQTRLSGTPEGAAGALRSCAPARAGSRDASCR